MVFSSYVFLFLFLPVVCIVYFILPERVKNGWLLASSLFFYGWNSPAFLPVLLVSIAVNYLAGRMIQTAAGKKRTAALAAGIITNLAILIYYKYADFIVENLRKYLHLPVSEYGSIVLPLGISFFTFQGMSYIIDVYRRDVCALTNPLDAALYISLFPQLVAGPIVRFKNIAKQLHGRICTIEAAGYGFRRFVFGLSKKILLADTFGMIADGVFSNPESWNMGSTWIGILAYTLQIYYDFSGYSDMAIGLGAVFGFHLDENFKYPYASTSITEFWRKWHISLSSWFRDYIYIPLGGNRVPWPRHIANVLIVWLLTGIWHGAEWSFFLWGVYYGVLLLMEKYLIRKKGSALKPLRWLFTMILVMIGWVFFRSANVTNALNYLQAMFSFKHTHEGFIIFMRRATVYASFWIAGFAGIFPVAARIKKMVLQVIKEESIFYAIAVNAYTAILLMVSVFFLIANNYNAFIYFQF